jgi:alpha-galactosidase
LVTRVCKEIGADLKITTTKERREALDGADFVITAVKIGGYDGLEEERAISEEHGYYRGFGDRVCDYYGGIGAYHQIRFMVDIANDMLELCPNAWFINTSNPVLESTNYILRHTKVKAIGVCHGHIGYKSIAKILGLDESKVSAVVCGFNHYNYMKSFLYEGKDAYPILDDWIEKHSEKYWKSDDYKKIEAIHAPDYLSPGAIDAYKLYGIMPIGDAVRAAAPWWHHTDIETKEKWYGPGGGFDSEHGWKQYFFFRDMIYGKLREILASDASLMQAYAEFGQEGTTEEHIPFIDSLTNDTDRILTLNVLNNGAITGLPDDILVEIHTRCNGNGISNISMGALPPKVMNNIILPRLARAENIMDAYLRGDRSVLYLMLMEDPRTRSFEQAKTVIDKLLAQPWNIEVNKHYE